jgi:hypothetical protein
MTRYHKRPFQNNPSDFQILVDHLRFTLVLSEQWVLTFRGLSIANISCCLSGPLVRAQRFTENFKDKIAIYLATSMFVRLSRETNGCERPLSNPG